jgi:hypothetical protein
MAGSYETVFQEGLIMKNTLISIIEILIIIDIPLILLYLRGKWPLKIFVPCLLGIPVLWYLTYAPIHELSHILGTYIAGGKVVDYKLIPRFWIGEVAGAWITPIGLSHPWQNLVMLSAPYLIDIASLITGYFVLLRIQLKNPFWIGFLFMILSLRPTFDLACETIGYYSGFMGDLYHIQLIIGGVFLPISLILSLGFSLLSIIRILKRYTGFSEQLTESV